MSGRTSATEIEARLPPRHAFARETREQEERFDALTADLQASLAREEALREERRELAERHVMLAQEFEHRLVNGLQLIASLLSLQSRISTTPEAAAELRTAARRVAALGRVHRQLHLLDHQENVEIRQYLQRLCGDLSGLLFHEATGSAITVEAAEAYVPTSIAVPLGFIVNELITNSAKHAAGNIVVRLESAALRNYSLSVSDNGPGLPAGFDPDRSTGLGMKIVQALVKQIGGGLQIARGPGGGACFTVRFDTLSATSAMRS